MARGQYLAFLDDDDAWLPDKISRQVEVLQSSGLQMCCTEGYIGQGAYDPTKKYRRYNSEHYYGQIRQIFSNKGSTLMDAGYPGIWTREFITVISRDLVAAVNGFKTIRKAEDYDLWMKAPVLL